MHLRVARLRPTAGCRSKSLSDATLPFTGLEQFFYVQHCNATTHPGGWSQPGGLKALIPGEPHQNSTYFPILASALKSGSTALFGDI